MNAPALRVRGLCVSYGAIEAVKSIELEVPAGELVALIGANGAGKTTSLKAIAGLLPWSGSVELFGREIRGAPAHQLLGRGLALVPEGRGLFARMTVAENLQMGAFTRRDAGIAEDFEKMYERFPRLKERARQLAGTLSGGEQQMLAMARALMSRPRLLLLDEPSMGLAPLLVERIFDVIREVSEGGISILLVEQNARLALEIAHRGYVMDSGQLSLSGPAASLLHDARVREAYLGESL
ncbi:MAG TPA: ABC transporter ATP-binding protein [Burkholderiaceae bacterium]|jgi:branched-chain amino acid transport system ATP-binding protein|nr:ABC transporter ATP-binding protein [Burkholderiaceae bacterium]